MRRSEDASAATGAAGSERQRAAGKSSQHGEDWQKTGRGKTVGLAAAAVSHGFDDRYIAGGGKSRIVGTAFFAQITSRPSHRSARQIHSFSAVARRACTPVDGGRSSVRSASRWASLSGQKSLLAQRQLPPADRRARGGTASGLGADVQGRHLSACRTFPCGTTA